MAIPWHGAMVPQGKHTELAGS